MCQGLVVHLWLRGLTWRVGMKLVQVATCLLVAVSPPVLPILGGKGAVGVGTTDVVQSSAPHHLHLQFSGWYAFQILINGAALHLTTLCLIWLGVTIFSLASSLVP